MKRKLAMVALLAMTAVILTACSNGEDDIDITGVTNPVETETTAPTTTETEMTTDYTELSLAGRNSCIVVDEDTFCRDLRQTNHHLCQWCLENAMLPDGHYMIGSALLDWSTAGNDRISFYIRKDQLHRGSYLQGGYSSGRNAIGFGVYDLPTLLWSTGEYEPVNHLARTLRMSEDAVIEAGGTEIPQGISVRGAMAKIAFDIVDGEPIVVGIRLIGVDMSGLVAQIDSLDFGESSDEHDSPQSALVTMGETRLRIKLPGLSGVQHGNSYRFPFLFFSGESVFALERPELVE